MAIVITAALTLLGGILLLIANQWAHQLVLAPWREQRQALGQVEFWLTCLGALYANPIPWAELPPDAREERQAAARALRQAAGTLLATTTAVWGYQRFRLTPPLADIREAVRVLLALSNALYNARGEGRFNTDKAYRVRHLLRFEVIAEEPQP